MPKKDNNNKSGAARRHKEKKRMEAEARQNKYDSLSPAEKMNLINSRPGDSRREKDRLLPLFIDL